MTVPASQAWYPLGGQRVTAQSSSREAEALARHAECQRQLHQAQPESSAAWQRLQAQAEMLQAQQATVVTSTGVGGFVSLAEAARIQANRVSTDTMIRSMELLYDWLTPEQRKMLCVRNYFDVVGGDTGRRYRLYPPAPYNIHKLIKDSEETEHKLCFVPKDSTLPKGDIWLCQKLALELDERNTLDIANHQNDIRYDYGG